MTSGDNGRGSPLPIELSWLELDAANAHLLLDLKEACDREGSTPAGLSFSELPESKLGEEIRGIVAVDNARQALAAAIVSLLPGEAHSCSALAYIRPGAQNKRLWQELLAWQLSEAKQLLREAGKLKRGTMEIQVHPHQRGWEEVLRSNGFSWINSTLQMRRELQDLPEPLEIGPYLTVEAWTDDQNEPARRLFNKLLVHDDAYSTVGKDQWREQRSQLQPDWSLVAVARVGDRPEMAGFLLASEESQVKEQGKQGYIDLLVVADSDASPEIFQTLAIETMHRQAAMRATSTSVIVEEPGDPLTTRLYEGLGFTRSYEVRTYATSF